MQISDDFLTAIPKTDLHVHLDGSLRLTTLIDLAQIYDIPMPGSTPQEMRERVYTDWYDSLEDYLEGFRYTIAVLAFPDSLDRIAYEFACDNYAEGVRYFEVRFAPQLHCDPTGQDLPTISQVVRRVNAGLYRATREWNEQRPEDEPEYKYGIIACALRLISQHSSPYYREFLKMHQQETEERQVALAAMSLVVEMVKLRDEESIPIVSLDIAGAEIGRPPEWFVESYRYAKEHLLGRTTHAGEATGPATIYRAITELDTQRIGHGISILDNKFDEKEDTIDEEIDEYVGRHEITFEVCMTSNLQTLPSLQKDPANHPLGDMIKEGISVSICTDNRLMSATTVVQEYRQACDTFNISMSQLKEIVLRGFQKAFFPGSSKKRKQYISSILSYYDRLEKEYLDKH